MAQYLMYGSDSDDRTSGYGSDGSSHVSSPTSSPQFFQEMQFKTEPQTDGDYGYGYFSSMPTYSPPTPPSPNCPPSPQESPSYHVLMPASFDGFQTHVNYARCEIKKEPIPMCLQTCDFDYIHATTADTIKLYDIQGETSVRLGPHQYDIDLKCEFDRIPPQQTAYVPTPDNSHISKRLPRVVGEEACTPANQPVTQTPARRHPYSQPTSSRSRKLPRAERLWEFLLRLLLSEMFNPSHIEWVDRDKGMFRLVNSRAIAKMWGKRKNNHDMTYEKLSRAMRYYYHRKILQPVFGKKLVYKFGPNSTGWQLPTYADYQVNSCVSGS